MSDCGCRRCMDERGNGVTVMGMFLPESGYTFVVCAICGNKRCPHANDHRLDCTDSNEPGQVGSAYP